MFDSWFENYRRRRAMAATIELLQGFDDRRLADLGMLRDNIDLVVAARMPTTSRKGDR